MSSIRRALLVACLAASAVLSFRVSVTEEEESSQIEITAHAESLDNASHIGRLAPSREGSRVIQLNVSSSIASARHGALLKGGGVDVVNSSRSPVKKAGLVETLQELGVDVRLLGEKSLSAEVNLLSFQGQTAIIKLDTLSQSWESIIMQQLHHKGFKHMPSTISDELLQKLTSAGFFARGASISNYALHWKDPGTKDDADEEIWTAMEVVPGMDYWDAIQKGVINSCTSATSAARKLVLAMISLHSYKTWHNDAHAANFFLTPQHDAVLIDFGCATKKPRLMGSIRPKKVASAHQRLFDNIFGWSTWPKNQAMTWDFVGVISTVSALLFNPTFSVIREPGVAMQKGWIRDLNELGSIDNNAPGFFFYHKGYMIRRLSGQPRWQGLWMEQGDGSLRRVPHAAFWELAQGEIGSEATWCSRTIQEAAAAFFEEMSNAETEEAMFEALLNMLGRLGG